MASQRPKQRAPKAALEIPTDIKLHVCGKCDQQFGSKSAMKEHRDAPSHNTMFICEPCNRTFGNRHGVAQHEQSPRHAKRLSQAKAPTVLLAQKKENKKSKVRCSRLSSFPILISAL